MNQIVNTDGTPWFYLNILFSCKKILQRELTAIYVKYRPIHLGLNLNKKIEDSQVEKVELKKNIGLALL